MAQDDIGVGGPPLLGVRGRNPTPPNSFRLWQYLLILFVVVLGAIYAAPNLYQPDPALQIRPTAAEGMLSAVQLQDIESALHAPGIAVKASEIVDGFGLVRVTSDENQLRAQTIISDLINAEGEYVIALNRASTTPAWLQNIGGKTMSLGLDLSGGVHFLLQVNMQQYLESVVQSTAQGMQDKLREARVVYIPNRAWVDGLVISAAFSNEAERDKGAEKNTKTTRSENKPLKVSLV